MRMKILFIFFAFIVIFCATAYYFVLTPSGSKIVADQALFKYLPIENFQYESVTGDLKSGMEFRNIEARQIQNLPADAVLRIQNVKVKLREWNIQGVRIDIENLRLRLPESDPIVISGNIEGKQLDLNIFSKGVYISEVLGILKLEEKFRGLQGTLSDVDIFLTGDGRKPLVQGDIIIEELDYQNVILRDIPTHMDVTVESGEGIQIDGTVQFKSGISATRNTRLNIQESVLTFSGSVANPSLNLKGKTAIEGIKIELSVKGTKEEPEIIVSSEPSLPRQSLLVMLATGKRMKGVEELMNQGALSQELAGDFIDYFIFGGKGDAFAKRFGLSSMTLKVTKDSQGIGVTKDLSEKLDVGYGYEQKKMDQDGQKKIQKFESNYQMTEKVSVSAGREIEQATGSVQSDESGSVDDKVLLKYKKNF